MTNLGWCGGGGIADTELACRSAAKPLLDGDGAERVAM